MQTFIFTYVLFIKSQGTGYFEINEALKFTITKFEIII